MNNNNDDDEEEHNGGGGGGMGLWGLLFGAVAIEEL